MIQGPIDVGRFTKNDTIHFKFTVLIADVPTTLGGVPVLSVYRDDSATEFTGGLTFTADYDARTGLVDVVIDTSNASYVAGHQYTVVITTGTAGAVSQVGVVVGHFALIPQPADLRQVNGGTTGTTAGVLQLTGLKIDSTGAAINAVDITAASDKNGINVDATAGTGNGIVVSSTRFGLSITSSQYPGALIHGGGDALELTSDHGSALNATTADTSPAVTIRNDSVGGDALTLHVNSSGSGAALGTNGRVVVAPAHTDDDAVALYANGAGKAINAFGQIAVAPANTDDDAMVLTPNGAGKAVNAAGQVLIAPAHTGDDALALTANGAGKAINAAGQVLVAPTHTNDDALHLTANGTGKALNAIGQVRVAPSHTNDDALVLTPNGSGKSISAVVEGAVGILESLRVANAVLGGKISGGGTTTETIRDVNDTKNRVVATVDAYGNRSAITLDLT
jgi:hypothetical protein